MRVGEHNPFLYHFFAVNSFEVKFALLHFSIYLMKEDCFRMPAASE